jgi:hypothetical protein
MPLGPTSQFGQGQRRRQRVDADLRVLREVERANRP